MPLRQLGGPFSAPTTIKRRAGRAEGSKINKEKIANKPMA